LGLLMAMLTACETGGTPPGEDPDRPDAGGAVVDGGDPDAVVTPPEDVPPSIDEQITINEVMAANALTKADEDGVHSDWVELYNPTDRDIRLDNYSMTDDLTKPRKAVFGSHVLLPKKGRLLVWLDGAPSRGKLHLGFSLAKEGGQLGLARPDGTFLDRIEYGAQETDFSAARTPDGSDAWAIEWLATPGTANASGPGSKAGPESGASQPEQVPSAGDPSEILYDTDRVVQLEIRTTPAAAAALEAEPFTIVEAELVYEGRVYGPVGLRLKGQNSFQPFSQKPSLRVKVDEFVDAARFFGLKDLTLNNMDNDFSMMHERMAYWVARKVGVPASRANHVQLTVNGAAYGLYTNLETVKKDLLERWFPMPEGPMWEGTDVDFAAQYVAAFELESGDDDRTLLHGAASALALPTGDEAIAAVGAYIDLPAFLTYWAFTVVVGQYDALPYSNPGDDFYVYADPANQRLKLMPWGMDETFYSSAFDVTQVKSVLAVQCLASPACKQAWIDQVWATLTVIETAGWVAEHDRVAAQIAPYAMADPKKPYDNATVSSFQTSMRRFITERRNKLLLQFPPTVP
jgi:CotH kinase protein/Lamin Tail Domain